MVRISVERDTNTAVACVKVEGRLTGDAMQQVARELESLDTVGGKVVVDLAGVAFADGPALSALRALPTRGAELMALSPFLRELLTTGPNGNAPGQLRTRRLRDREDADDQDLVDRLRDGDATAYETIVRRYGPRLLATARRLMKSEEEAQDVVQEAYLSAFRAIESFAGGAQVSTWLHRIVVNAALMRLRSRRRRREESIEDLLPRFDETGHFAEPPQAWGATAEHLLERKDAREAVRAAIAELPESYRTVLVLRDVEELDTAEVASALGITANAVKVRLHRARQALRTVLAQSVQRPSF